MIMKDDLIPLPASALHLLSFGADQYLFDVFEIATFGKVARNFREK